MNEDFVSFEIAKKLKEKGYTLDTAHHYDDNGGIVVSLVEFDERCVYPCPKIHQVLRWLREEKKIHIIVEIADCGWYYTIYPNIRWENGELKSDKYIMSFKNKASYEQAALAGIEYTLDNLI